MKKVLLIHHSGLIGGAGVSLLNTIDSIKESDVIVCVPSEPADMNRLIFNSFEQQNVKVCVYGRRIGAITYYSGGDSCLKLRFWYRLFLILLQFHKWDKIIDDINPDIVMVNSKILCWMSLIPSLRNRRTICFVRETMHGNKHRILNRVISKLLDKFSEVVFLSKYDEEKEGLTNAQTTVIHDYVNEDKLDNSLERTYASEQLGVSQHRFHVLYVGGISSMKGFDLAAKAVLKAGEDVELLVAGKNFADAFASRDKKEVRFAQNMQEYLKQNDLHKQIHILGKQDDMSMCYAACDVLVFPMRAPHQARPVFEAGYFKKPAIITDFENINEFVREGENGFKVKNEEIDAIAEKLVFLRNHVECCMLMGEKNFHIMQALHDRTVNCEKIAHMVKENECK